MKHLKPFNLFESDEYSDFSGWNPKNASLVFYKPEVAPVPFVRSDTEEDIQENIENLKGLFQLIPRILDRIEPINFLNIIKYLNRVDDLKVAMITIQNLFANFPYLRNRKYMRITQRFEDHYYPDMQDELLSAKKEANLADPDETHDDIELEIEELEAGVGNVLRPQKPEVILKGRELENAINYAIDTKNVEEFKRLSKMLPESRNAIFKEYLKIFG